MQIDIDIYQFQGNQETKFHNSSFKNLQYMQFDIDIYRFIYIARSNRGTYIYI